MSCQGKTFLAIVPARGGSRRLPGKNIRPLAGKPLLVWTLEAARQSRHVDDVVVSTDSPEIAEVARQHGVEVPFLRPAELATDTATTESALRHALAQWEKYRGRHYDYVVVLQPTSPLRRAAHIDEAIEKAVERSAEAIVSVCPAEHPPQWMNVLPEDDSMTGFLEPSVVGRRSQDLPVFFRLNGAVSVVMADVIRAGQSIWSLSKIYACRMAAEDSVDIDTQVDFLLAEALMKLRQQNKSSF